jgi:hypothetical protein
MHGVQCTCAVCRWYMKPSKSWGLRLARVQVDSGPSGSSGTRIWAVPPLEAENRHSGQREHHKRKVVMK